MYFHDPVDTFMVDNRFSSFPEKTVEYSCDTAVPISGPLITELTDKREIFLIIHSLVSLPSCSSLLILMRAGNTQSICYSLHGISSFSDKGCRNKSFFSRAISSASLRISTSMVFFPSVLSSSLILAFRTLTSDTGTTRSSLLTASRAPSRMSLRQVKSRLGWTSYFLATAEMLIPGCSASFTIALFSSADQRRLLWTEVITLMVLMILLFLNYSHMTIPMTTTYFEVSECPIEMGATSMSLKKSKGKRL